MSFNQLDTTSNVEADKDYLGGAGVMESGLYDFTIKMMYGTVAASGAKAVNVTLESDSGQTLRQTIYITNAKGANYYVKDGKNYELPGFITINSLCMLAGNKKFSDIAFEDKVIPVYDYEQKKELPTKVPVAVEMIGKKITVGIIKQVVDKTKDSGQVDSKGKKVYVPTGETREENEIDKIFRAEDGFTVAELRAKSEKAEFKDQWATKNTGVTRNKSKGAPAGTTTGAPATGTTGAPAATQSLFDD